MVEYYFKGSDGPNLGPMGADEFQQRQEAGEIDGNTMVWRSGMTEWSTYTQMAAAQAAKASPPPIPARKAKASAAAAPAGPRPGFQACAACGQEWAEALLFTEGKQKICGNCQARLKEQSKSGRRKAGEGTSMTAWFCIVLAIVSSACLAYKITHPGPPVERAKVKELTAPSTYGK